MGNWRSLQRRDNGKKANPGGELFAGNDAAGGGKVIVGQGEQPSGGF